MIRIQSGAPALVLAPMEGLADAPMRAVQGELGAFDFAVSEFVRVSHEVVPPTVFHKVVPELRSANRTPTGLLVQVQLLGGDPQRMARSAQVAYSLGASAIDINFGCPAPTVNSHDGGATLLKYPHRLREIVRAVREALPPEVPVSAKLRLGWDDPDAILENAVRAAEGGAAWLTIHGRTRAQAYRPPAHWHNIGKVRQLVDIPVVANGDIWSVAAFRQCREETGCLHFMLGRGAIADPFLTQAIRHELGLGTAPARPELPWDWHPYLLRLVHWSQHYGLPASERAERYCLSRLKQWLKLGDLCGTFAHFDQVKRSESLEELWEGLRLSGRNLSPNPGT